jgi:hypothetical protein
MNSIYKLIIVTFFLTFISCNKTPSTLTGNIFWKYNNYVGNKPDAGAKISIYSLDENPKDSVYTTIADINGNFKIENINPGEYFLIVNSKNTKSLPSTHLENIKINSKNLSKLFIENLHFYLGEFDSVKSSNLHLLNEINVENIKEHNETNKQLNDKFSNIIQSFPNKFKTKLNLQTGYDNAIYFKKINIAEDKSVIENIDFGLTEY